MSLNYKNIKPLTKPLSEIRKDSIADREAMQKHLKQSMELNKKFIDDAMKDERNDKVWIAIKNYSYLLLTSSITVLITVIAYKIYEW